MTDPKGTILERIIRTKAVFWTNPKLTSCEGRKISPDISLADIDDAEARLQRFAPYLAQAFPETAASGGLIESALQAIPAMQAYLGKLYGTTVPGNVYLKLDSHLPISGSVKARGGIYEVLKTAERIALASGMLSLTDDYAILAEERFHKLFSQWKIVVGSTGNLGLSIGIMGAKLGFTVCVHMSADAKQWKKDMLREKGATVIEHESDYGVAVAAGRAEAEADPQSYFIDDENSLNLFLGYAVAAKRLQRQLIDMHIVVDEQHPLFVYIPCGVGGAAGGITFGLRTLYGNNVHCFFAEPTHSPSMLLGLLTGKHNGVSVQNYDIDNKTAADGLACGRPSALVGKILEKDISGVFTVQDDRLYRLLHELADRENIYLEPSALAGFPGPVQLMTDLAGQTYLQKQKLLEKLPAASHILWATGGGMVPADIMKEFYDKGAN